MSTLVIRGFRSGPLVTRGLGAVSTPPHSLAGIYPDPFAATDVYRGPNPFAATTTTRVDPFAATDVYSGPNPFGSTVKYKGR